ncbi:MAG: 50S ribosomal protein L11 [Chloroflexota bacterium]
MPPPKKVLKNVTLHIPASEAGPGRVGKDLGPLGINIMEFCRGFNELTAARRGFVIPVAITVYEDRSFTFVAKTPTTASLLVKAAGMEKGAARPNGVATGIISRAQLYEIAQVKLPDLDALDVDAAARSVAGTARSMGIAVRA